MIKIINSIYNILYSYFSIRQLRKEWRTLNQNNETVLINRFNISKVTVGKKSYGPLEVYDWKSENEQLDIGNFVSIARGVKFILGGNHTINIFSTFPFKVKVLGCNEEATSKGKIVIEDDVWIGMDVVVLSGVTVGKGSVIGAGSVISKNVPPYAVVAGNPAQVIKYRFDDDIIRELIKIDFSKIDDKFVQENIDLIYNKLDLETIQTIKKKLEI